MADSDDRIARRYRELAREEPPLAVDAAILARARRKVRSRPGFARWAAPVSIAAVLVLGIGVSLRMQLEQPGVETSLPERANPATSNLERYAPQSATLADAARAPEKKAVPADTPAPALEEKPAALSDGKRRQFEFAKQAPKAALAPPPEERMKDRADSVRTEDAPIIASPGAMAPIAPPGVTFVPAPEAAPAPAPAAPAASSAPAATRVAPATVTANLAPPPPARAEIDVATRAVPEPPAAAATGGIAAQRAPQAQLAAPRAKKENEAAADSFNSRDSRDLNKSIATPDVERDRELERIAKLRESKQHADADRALEAFRKRYPDFRIPEAMWERVRPR